MKRTDKTGKNTNPNADVNNAHKQADRDIARDPDNIHSPNDDLDEGELARLGEDPDGI
jgi:hypothetical protein